MKKKDPCPDCGKLKLVEAKRCKPCYAKMKNKFQTWRVKGSSLDPNAKLGLIASFNATSSKQIKTDTLVFCYYHPPTRKNILAWRHTDVKKYLKANGHVADEYSKTVCQLSSVDVNLTGIDLSLFTTRRTG